jgi:hypothetical protein
LRAIRLTGVSAARGTVEKMAHDPKVHMVARWEALRTLAALPGVNAASVFGSELLVERNPSRRSALCYEILKLADPAAIPYLERARGQEVDEGLRTELGLAIELLGHPTECSLSQQAGLGAERWECVYRCPGPRDMFTQHSSVACPKRSPLPQPHFVVTSP